MNDCINISGKNAIITGANRGIGNAIVRKFAQNGCNIWACARRCTDEFESEMKSLAMECEVHITPVYFDLADLVGIKEAFKEIYKAKIPIDVLVNVAGMFNSDIFAMTPMSKLQQVFACNFFGPAQLMQLVLKAMSKQKSGSMINISSIAGEDVNPNNCAYGSSKAALNQLTRNLASEAGRLGVRVNAIAPSPTDTDMGRTASQKLVGWEQRRAMERLATSEEIANVALFLAGDMSSFISGQVIRVDGGAK